jgi:HYR domain
MAMSATRVSPFAYQMRRLGSIAIFVTAVMLVGSAAAPGSVQDGPTLVFDVSIVSKFVETTCPPGSSVGTECFQYSAGKIVPGLGRTSLAWNETIDRTGSCGVWKVLDGSWITPKGTIPFSGTSEGCPSVNEGTGATVQITFAPGSSGASGTATAKFGRANVSAVKTEPVRWSGTLAIPNVTFDTTPPQIAHVANKVVKIHRGHRGRAFYKVAATDAVDGLLKAKCRPRSGSFFPIGRTRVRCSATDTSGNTATTSFLVIIKRRS